MKKTALKFCILLTVFVLFSTSSSYAQDATSDVQIEFVAGQGPTYPVDPDGPDTEDKTEPPVTGSLAIVSVSDFSFGAIPLTTKGGFYDIEPNRPNIQIVDLRGTAVGWSVTAEVSKFESAGAESLLGSIIHIYNGRPISTSDFPAPTQEENVRLTADGEPRLMITADDGAGAGLWVMRWYPEDEEMGAYIQLEIPEATVIKGVHTAKINWTLRNTP